MRRDSVIIAIDGPAASGKSTTAKKVAEQLSFIYVNTGAMYRAVTLAVLKAGIDPNIEERVNAILPDLVISIEATDSGSKTFLDGEDVTREIRKTAVTKHVSVVSAMPTVREEMVAIQRRIATGKNAVVEGRDIGTVVFPQAELKFYITASYKVRAKRRQEDLKELGIKLSIEEIISDLQRRDGIDSSRTFSPLMKADDAIVVNTTDLTINEQVTFIVEKVEEYLSGRRETKIDE
ncbi:MAG: (d)CMP kinase [Fidelibacterota bacterium]